MPKQWLTGGAFVATLMSFGPVSAEEQTLTFRLVTHDVAMNVLEPAAGSGLSLGSYESVGVAAFEDGRIAFKKFVRTASDTSEGGEFVGYSTYTFENGDALTAKFTGGWSMAEGVSGEYEVLSGAGAYEGVTGVGSFGSADDSWEDADLMTGSFTLQVPGS